jgi:hypothetical protein
MLASEPGYADRPYGSTGEWLTPGPSEPPPPVAQPLQIPPPDWEAELELVTYEQQDQPGAVEVMIGEQGEEWPEPDFRRPVVHEPLLRFQPPPPDWRLEEREQAQREEAS